MSNRRYSSGPGKGTAAVAVVGVFALIIAVYAVVLALGAAILSWGWNLVVPTTFGGPTLDFGAAYALLVVFAVIRSFLFGGFTYRKS